MSQISFEKPDLETFDGLRLAYEAFRVGGSMPTVYNAANEKAVSLFLNRKIKFLEIAEIIEYAMHEIPVILNPSVSQILEKEQSCYELIESRW